MRPTKEEPFYAAAYAYDATHLIAAAIRHSERYDADTINKALRSIDALAPATQAVRFRPDGSSITRRSVSTRCAAAGGKP